MQPNLKEWKYLYFLLDSEHPTLVALLWAGFWIGWSLKGPSHLSDYVILQTKSWSLKSAVFAFFLVVGTAHASF